MRKLFALFAILFAFYANAQDPVTSHAGYVNIGMMDEMAANDTILVRNGPGRLGYRLKSDLDQQLSLAGNIVSLTGSPSIDLTPILGGGGGTWGGILGTLSDQLDLQAELDAKQDLLVSATNIRTINGLDLLGSGNIVIATGGDLLSTNNLSDVANAATALANIGGAALAGAVFTGNITAPAIIKTGATGNDILLGDGTTTPLSSLSTGALLIANNLSDVASVPTSQQNLNLEPGVDVEVYAANTDKDHTNDLYAISGSPVGNPSWWVGNKAAYYAAAPIVADFIVILDSVAPTAGSGLGDMLKSVYDINENNNVDNSEELGGFAGSYYLNRSNHTGSQLASTISDIQDAITNNTAVLANTAKTSNVTHTGEVTGSSALTITNNAVTSNKIADGAVNSSEVANGAIVTNKIANGAVNSDKIAINSIQTTAIQADAVTNEKMAPASVGTTELIDGSITTQKIVDGQVQNSDIGDNAITSSKIASGAVGQSEIATNAVGSSEIQDLAVNTAKILNSTILLEDLNSQMYVAPTTFTPTLYGMSSGTYTASTARGVYTRIGKQVTVQVHFQGVNGTSPTGILACGGFPVAHRTAQNGLGRGVAIINQSNVNFNNVSAENVYGETFVTFKYQAPGSTLSNTLSMQNVDFSNGQLSFSITYITD